jgi:CubicO group peptidase (beta-lactamase class C family)
VPDPKTRRLRRNLHRVLAIAACATLGDAAIPEQSAATARHKAAQEAGLKALHLCSGYFATEAPRSLTDATLGANANVAATTSMKTRVDEARGIVSVEFSNDMPPRFAVARKSMGCTMLPIGADVSLADQLARPSLVAPRLDDQLWPTGDKDASRRLPARQKAALDQLLDDAFQDNGSYGGTTWGLVVIKNGKIVAERYGRGFDVHVAARTNSMCKSLGVSLIGVGVHQGLLSLEQKAPLAEWKRPGDPRGQITLHDLLHMASGLYSNGAQDTQVEIYRSGAAIAEVAALNMMDATPGTRFVYAGPDTNLAVRALRQAYAREDDYPSFPYRELLWKIGMTRTVVETDWNNDFIVSGQCWSTARDFGRLGLLYLSDGQWSGEQLLPKGWNKYVATPAPAQPAKPSIGGDAGYGAQFWLFGGMDGLPTDTYSAFGAKGQYAVIVPSKDLVIVRRGFDQPGSGFKIQRFAADVVNVVAR